jgi:hypothetical protein
MQLLGVQGLATMADASSLSIRQNASTHEPTPVSAVPAKPKAQRLDRSDDRPARHGLANAMKRKKAGKIRDRKRLFQQGISWQRVGVVKRRARILEQRGQIALTRIPDDSPEFRHYRVDFSRDFRHFLSREADRDIFEVRDGRRQRISRRGNGHRDFQASKFENQLSNDTGSP